MVLKRFREQLVSDIFGGLDLLSAGFSHPVLTLRDPLGAVELTRKEGALKTISRTIRTTALAAGALLLPTAAGLRFAGGQILTKPTLIPIGLAIGGAAAVSPKVRKGIDIATDPSTLIRGGEIAGEVIESGKIPDISIQEGLITGGVIGAAAVLIPTIIGSGKKVKEKLTPLEKQQIQPTLPAQTQLEEIPTPIGAESVIPKVKPTEKPTTQPINIDIDIEAPAPTKNEIFINNIIQNI